MFSPPTSACNLVWGAFGLPMSLGLILVCGAELLTANSAYISAAVFEIDCWLHLHNIWLAQNVTCKICAASK